MVWRLLPACSIGNRNHRHPGAIQSLRITHGKRERMMFSGFGSDLRHVLRGLRKSPGFTAVAVLSLALGIGANMAMFGVVKTLLLTPLSVDTPEELALVGWTRQGELGISGYGTTSYPDPATGIRYNSSLSSPLFRALQESAPAGVQLFSFTFLRGVAVSLAGQPALLAGGALVDGAYFSTLRVGMALGRPIGPADNVPGAPLVAVLSHSFWTKAFGGDPEILGKIVRVNGKPAEVIGVTATGFKGLSMGGFFPQTEISVPMASQPQVFPQISSTRPLESSDDVFWLRVMARVRGDVSRASTEEALARVLRDHPSPLSAADGYQPALRLLPGDRGAQPVRASRARLLYFLLGVVGIVLVIACVNLAGLILARGVARQREIAVRRALGVGRLRLVSQMLMEGLVLSVMGYGLGIALTVVGRGFLRDVLTGSVSADAFRDGGVSLITDPVVLLMGAGLTVFATIGFGLLPALRLSGLDPSVWLKPRGAGLSGPRPRVAKVLIAVQVAISVPLVVGAALFLRTMKNLGGLSWGSILEESHSFR
jgi:predicted permease